MPMPTAISPELFRAALREYDAELPQRPSESFWKALSRRLAQDYRAWFGGVTVVFLLLATLLGPWLWPRDPALQNPTRISLGPSAAVEARVVTERGAWRPRQAPLESDGKLEAVQSLRTVEAHTEWVRLQWQPVAGATGYHIYRNTHPPRDRQDLGLPLGETWSPEVVGFEDRLQLQPRTYYYTVVASDALTEAEAYSTVAVTPEPAILLLSAQLQGLAPVDAEPEQWRGRSVTLPAHPLGTDYLGRDILARLLHGARTSLFIGIVAPVVYIAFGTLYGAIAGLVGGRWDNILMRLADFVVALPFLLFMILFRVAFGIGPGESGIFPLLLAMVLLSWPASARLVRGQVLQLREEPFIDAARLAGAGSGYLIHRHLLPNIVGVILVALTFAIPSAIFTEAFLSFIGMGVTPPTPSWGSMSNDGMRTLLTHPHELLAPAACISITVLAFNVLGDALRDALDSRLEAPA